MMRFFKNFMKSGIRDDSGKSKMQFTAHKWYAAGLMVIWTCLVIGSLTWNIVTAREETLSSARIQARVAYEKDIIYRRWNTGHGGVFVPVTQTTGSNPYLSDIPERDITTPSGKALTLMNPAYMTRQVHELAKSEYGVLGHITSLAPIRPQNAADSWETNALQSFEHGEMEVSAIETMNGHAYMRLMRPLMTEKGCLKCHARYGSKVGEIRGGISVSVPMEPLWVIYYQHIYRILAVQGILWLIGLSGIIFGVRRLTKSEQNRKFAERSLRKSFGQLEEKVEERTESLAVANKELQKKIVERKQAETELKKHRDHLKDLVQERTSELATKNAELESMNKLFVDREFRIKELKEKLKEKVEGER